MVQRLQRPAASRIPTHPAPLPGGGAPNMRGGDRRSMNTRVGSGPLRPSRVNLTAPASACALAVPHPEGRLVRVTENPFSGSSDHRSDRLRPHRRHSPQHREGPEAPPTLRSLLRRRCVDNGPAVFAQHLVICGCSLARITMAVEGPQ